MSSPKAFDLIMSTDRRTVRKYCVVTKHGADVRKWRLSRRDKKFRCQRTYLAWFDEMIADTVRRPILHKGKKP